MSSLGHSRTKSLSVQQQSSEQTKEDEVIIKDEELDQLKAKYYNSQQLYEDCTRYEVELNGTSEKKEIKVDNKNGIFHQDKGIQEKIREITLKRLQKTSNPKELQLYPTLLHDTLNKRLGAKISSEDFMKKMCSHFRKQVEILNEEQNCLFKRTAKCYSEYHSSDIFTQLQESLDNYSDKIMRKKAIYLETSSRISQGLLMKKHEVPNITMQKGSKLLFINNLQQPPIHQPFKTLDYKLYLNDKLRKYKSLRNLKKFRQFLKHFPTMMLTKLYPEQTIKEQKDLEELRSSKRSREQEEIVPEVDKFAKYRNLKDLEVLKQRLVELCRFYGLYEDINVDDGAFLLFKVDARFKEVYMEQQKELDFKMSKNEDNEKSPGRKKLTEQTEPEINGRVRYLQKAMWIDEYLDYEEKNATTKMSETIYDEKLDTLLKSWFEFVQISDVKESIIKIDFRLNRVKEQYSEKKIFQQEVFYEFLKAYMKLQVLKARSHILKLYDSLNFFRSVERTISIRKQELHLESKENYTNNSMKTLGRSKLSSEIDGNNKTSHNDIRKLDMFSPFYVKEMQDDKITFNKDSIDVYAESTSKLIMYDAVIQDFQYTANKALQMGAHLVDKNLEKRTQKGNFNLILDDLDREFLLVQILNYEADFQFSKAKYVWNLLDILTNTFRFKSSADVMRHIQELIQKRPQVSLFEDSLDLSYQQETKYLEKLAGIAADILTHQKSQENIFDEFQAEIFSKEEILDLMSLYQEAQKGTSPVSSTHLINLGELEDRTHDDRFFRGQEDQIYVHTQVVENEFSGLKPYEFLEKTFYTLLEIENTIHKSVDYLYSSNSDLEKIFDLRNSLLSEAREIWEKVKYNIPILSSNKDFESLEYDILLDMPNSFYGIMKDQKLLNFKQIVSSSKFGSLKGSSKNQDDGVKKVEQFQFIPEENYFQNLIEFIRLKETIMACLLSSAYQTQIYQHQIVLYGREDIYHGLLEKPGGDLQKDFFSLLLNLENIQLDFNLKDLGDSKLIIPNSTKLGELWKISEYLLLHEALIQNALQINYSYVLDLRKTFLLKKNKKDESAEFYKAIQSKHSQTLFFNVIEKKKVWLNQYKSSFFATVKQAAAATTVNAAEKNERVLEFNNNIRHYLYYDALRIQTVETTRLLKDMVLRAGLNQNQIFNIREAFTEENPKKFQVQISDIFADSGENTPLETKTRHAKILEDYIGEGGKWLDPFIIPAVQDIIYMEISPTEKEALLAARGHNNNENPTYNNENKLALAQKVLQVFESEVTMSKKDKKKGKLDHDLSQLLSRLKETSMMSILEWCHHLFQILMYELFETTIQWSKTDVLMMYEEGCRDQELYRRNQLKVEQGMYQTIEWWKKTKSYILKVKKGLKVGVSKEVAFKTTKKILKKKTREVNLSIIQLAFDLRKQGDTESLKLLRRFLIKTNFNTLNYLYVFNENFCFHNYYKSQKIVKNQLQDVGLQDSETMKLLDFVFIAPLLKRKQDKNSLFIDFTNDYELSAKNILFDLYTLPRNVKALLHSRILNINLTLENLIADKDVLIHENLHEYVKSSNKILKKNLSNMIMEEALLSLRKNIRPFTHTSVDNIIDFEKNIQYHYSIGLGDSESSVPPLDLEVDLKKSITLKNVLKTQIEKFLLTEGIDFYQRNVTLLRAQRDKGTGSLKDIPGESDLKKKVLEGLEHQRFLPFFQGYAHKLMNKSLFIESHNLGQCIVIPMKDFEQDINELNNEVLQYFGELQYDIQRRYNGRMSIVKNQFRDLTKELERVKYSLDYMRKNQERAIEARLAEEGTRVIFQVDMLKKKINYILEEQEHIIKEVKDNMRQEFENKLIQDEVALKKANKRFYEYREGMSFDIRRFIEAEKNQTLKAINDKKNQTFASMPLAENPPAGNFEIREVENGPLVSKLYELLKKTRALYQFKEVVMREKCQKEIDQIKKKAFGNQNLLHKVNDLQNSEATLKDGLTEARKELALLERRNKVLRNALQKDSGEKIRLYREHSAARSDAVDLQNKYADALKTKAIFIKTDKSRDTPSGNNSKYYLKSHKSTLHSIKSPLDSIEVAEDNTTTYINLQDMPYESGGTAIGNVYIQENNNETLETRTTTKNRPSTATASIFKSLKDTLSTSGVRSPQAAVSHERNKSIQKNSSSYLDLAGSPTRQVIIADGVKVVKKRRNKTEDQAFLMKRFIPPK